MLKHKTSKHSLLMKLGQNKNDQKILQKLQSENQFQALLCLQRIKHDLYWKMKFLKQATYIDM